MKTEHTYATFCHWEHILGIFPRHVPSRVIVGDNDPFPVLAMCPAHSKLFASLPDDLGEMSWEENVKTLY